MFWIIFLSMLIPCILLLGFFCFCVSDTKRERIICSISSLVFTCIIVFLLILTSKSYYSQVYNRAMNDYLLNNYSVVEEYTDGIPTDAYYTPKLMDYD